jgi:hypothetical protein
MYKEYFKKLKKLGKKIACRETCSMCPRKVSHKTDILCALCKKKEKKCLKK